MTAAILAAFSVSEAAEGVVLLAAYAVVGLAMMLAGYALLDALTPGQLTKLIREGSDNAAALAVTTVLSVAIIVASPMLGQEADYTGLGYAVTFGSAGLLFQAIGMFVLRTMLFKTRMHDLMHAERLTPDGVFLAAATMALGIVMAVAAN